MRMSRIYRICFRFCLRFRQKRLEPGKRSGILWTPSGGWNPKSQWPKRFDRTHRFGDDADELLSFAGRDVVEFAALFFDAEFFKHLQQDAVTLDCPVVPFLVMAVSWMTGQDHTSVVVFSD